MVAGPLLKWMQRHAAARHDKLVAAIDLNRRGGSVNRPYLIALGQRDPLP